MSDLGPIKVSAKTGDEPFFDGDDTLEFSLIDYWRWASSDLVNNAARGVMAEFLVAKALGVETCDRARDAWAPFDLETASGVKIEVKSSAFIQSWHQERHSTVTFGIRTTHKWEAITNVLANKRRRHADLYVFCLLAHKEKATVNPMDVSQWCFYVVPTRELNEHAPDDKTIGLKALDEIAGGAVPYGALRQEVTRKIETDIDPES